MSVFTTKTIDYLSSIYINTKLESSITQFRDYYNDIIDTCKLLKRNASIKFDKVKVKPSKQTGNQRMKVYIYISNNRHLLTKPLSENETHFLDLIQFNLIDKILSSEKKILKRSIKSVAYNYLDTLFT